MNALNVLMSILLLLSLQVNQDYENVQHDNKQGNPQHRTVEIIGIDKMKFVVDKNRPGVVVGDTVSTAQGKQFLELEAIRVEPGNSLTIRLKTRSELPPRSMAHNWVLLKQSADRAAFDKAAVLAVDNNYIPREKEDEIIARTGLATGGETVEVTLEVPERQGMYDYLCSFPGHFANGMRGKLIVQE